MEKNFYHTLGISKDANDDTIEKAYHSKVLKYHSNKKKSPEAAEKLKLVVEAYEVLRDKNKRLIYDHRGEEGLKRVGTDADSIAEEALILDLFSKVYVPKKCFFQRKSFPRKKPKKPNTSVPNIPSFGQNSNPRSNSFTHNPSGDILFSSFCQANNLRSHSFTQGNLHSGAAKSPKQDTPIERDLYVTLEDVFCGCVKKMKISRKVLNPDRITTKREDKILTVNVQPGVKAGTRITFHQEGDQGPNMIPSDVVFIIKDQPHPYFKRENSDILYTCSLPLIHKIFGPDIEIPTLTNEKIEVKKTEVKSNTIRVYTGYGLPLPEEPDKQGDLKVSFKIM